MTRNRLLPCLAMAVIACAGCSPVGPSPLVVTLSAEDSVASPGEPILLLVTATNVGVTPVRWGPGSSTCQLGLQVRVDGTDVFAPPAHGVCTMDLVTHVLLPGQSRTEAIPWAGMAQLGDTLAPVVLLEPGAYELRGWAQPTRVSAPILVTLEGGS